VSWAPPPEETSLSQPTLTRDGQRLAVLREVQGNTDVWLIDVGRGVPSRLTFHAALDTAPIGRNDPRVNITESEQIAAAVKSNGVPRWYLIGNDEGHGFAKRKNLDFQFYATVHFIQTYLLN